MPDHFEKLRGSRVSSYRQPRDWIPEVCFQDLKRHAKIRQGVYNLSEICTCFIIIIIVIVIAIIITSVIITSIIIIIISSSSIIMIIIIIIIIIRGPFY